MAKAKKFKQVDLKDLSKWSMVQLHRALCKRYPKPEKTKGGIVLPDDSRKNPAGLAWIIKVGEDGERRGFKVGDTLFLSEMHISQGAIYNADLGTEYFYTNLDDAILHHPQEKK